MPEPQYLTVNDAAAILGISRASMYRLLQDPDFRAAVVVSHLTPRGKMRIERQSLLEWAKSRR